ncbi:hypothetical protein D9M73_56890 [compost metagenome]
MAAIALTESSVTAVKNALRDEFPDVKSAHVSEALAHSLGYQTNAALRAALATAKSDPPFVLLRTDRMLARLSELGYPDDPEFDFELLMGSPPEVISTEPMSAYEIEYNTKRKKAWRNLMVCATNAALEQKLFGLTPGDNRFPDNMRRGHPFDFVLPNGLSARGSISDAGFDELSIHAAVNPKGDAVLGFNAGFYAGDAVGSTWIERRDGAWMQTSETSFHCRRTLLAVLAGLDIEPAGYGDRGRVIM